MQLCVEGKVRLFCSMTPAECFPGHVHAYERTFPINNYAVDQCGVRWLTMGDGGNVEGLYKTFASQNGTCFCTPINNSTSSNGCPCTNVLPSSAPQVPLPRHLRDRLFRFPAALLQGSESLAVSQGSLGSFGSL